MSRLKIMGFSCSLRNARHGAGSAKLVSELLEIENQDDLKIYLQEQTKVRLKDFIDAGVEAGTPFDLIYKKLCSAKGDRGLSNSEAGLAAALWGASQCDVDIAHCGLSEYFPMSGEMKGIDELRRLILSSDAILLGGPVYFGDRSSIAQDFIEFVRDDPELHDHVRGKVYAGITVGAKRNGGQETALIYQLVDVTNMNMLAVGNDSETTSQYGGTLWAGDIGTAYLDNYGLDTCIGTGRRVASIAQMLDRGRRNVLTGKTKIALWLMQDVKEGKGYNYVKEICDELMRIESGIEITIVDLTKENVMRCIACDVCPTDPGKLEEYRCIIGNKDDVFKHKHFDLINYDAIIPAAYSPVDRTNIISVYQRFVERTRYIRRDDYALGNRLVAPMVISEINSNQNLHIRMLTSLVRHHTVLHHPLLGFELNDDLLNREFLMEQAKSFVRNAIDLTAGRLSIDPDEVVSVAYNPIGYEISAEKVRVDNEEGRSQGSKTSRLEAHDDQRQRLK